MVECTLTRRGEMQLEDCISKLASSSLAAFNQSGCICGYAVVKEVREFLMNHKARYTKNRKAHVKWAGHHFNYINRYVRWVIGIADLEPTDLLWEIPCPYSPMPRCPGPTVQQRCEFEYYCWGSGAKKTRIQAWVTATFTLEAELVLFQHEPTESHHVIPPSHGASSAKDVRLEDRRSTLWAVIVAAAARGFEFRTALQGKTALDGFWQRALIQHYARAQGHPEALRTMIEVPMTMASGDSRLFGVAPECCKSGTCSCGGGERW